MPLTREVLALHGFLGSPSDWKGFGWKAIPIEPAASLSAWAEEFCRTVTEKPVLLGYSMGARLAMHAVVERPHLFSGVVLVSGNPGLSTEAERNSRRESDEKWARRFEAEDWEKVVHEWDSQAVFSGVPSPFTRDPSTRSEASSMLRNFSLGRQEDLREKLEKLPIPMLWIAGERDEKFVQIARELNLGKRATAEVWLAPNAGHRVPWEAAHAFQARVTEFRRGLATALSTRETNPSRRNR